MYLILEGPKDIDGRIIPLDEVVCILPATTQSVRVQTSSGEVVHCWQVNLITDEEEE